MLLSVNLQQKRYQKQVASMSVVHSDVDLVEGLRNSNRKAQELFYKQYFPQMFPTALRYTSSKEDAHEIINTAFLKVINGISKYKNDNFGGWVRTIVKRTAIDYCRKFNYKNIQTVEILEVDERSYNMAMDSLAIEEIMKLIQELPDASRTVFNLFVFEDLKHDEIADKLGISKGTSKWHVANARKFLMEKIQKFN